MQMTDKQIKNVMAQTFKNRADMDDLEIVDLTFKMKNTARDKDNKRDDQELAYIPADSHSQTHNRGVGEL